MDLRIHREPEKIRKRTSAASGIKRKPAGQEVRTKFFSSPLLSGLLQLGGGRLDQIGFRLQYFAHSHDLRLRLLPVLLLDRLAHGRNRLDPVSGVESRRVD